MRPALKNLVFPLIVALVGAFGIVFFQERQENKSEREKIFQQVAQSMDARMLRMRRLINAYREHKTKTEVDAQWRAYQDLVEKWNTGLTSNSGRLSIYYGPDASSCFLYLHTMFARLGGKVEHPYANDLDSLSRELDSLSRRYHRFGEGLSRAGAEQWWRTPHFDARQCR
jgi:hypothetical protein